MNGRYISMKPAYKSKVLEVEKAIAELKSLENTGEGENMIVDEKASPTNKHGKNAEHDNLKFPYWHRFELLIYIFLCF